VSDVLENPRQFEFFELVKLLKQRDSGAVLPGGAGPASQENVRFRPPLHMGFPTGDVEAISVLDPQEEGERTRYRVEVNFMGLYGPSSPMPAHFTEEMMWAGLPADGARDFVDIFHHRLISFLFRGWQKYRYAEQFHDAPLDDFSRRALCLLGMGTAGIESGSGLPALPMLRTAGLMADRHRSAVGLEQLLRSHFDLEVIRIESCRERRANIPVAQTLRLGRPTARLGDSAVLGERVVDRASTFLIVLGPFDVSNARRFLPGGDEMLKLVRLTRLYVRDPLHFRLELRVPAENVPPLRLTERAKLGLGHLTWLSPDGRHEGRASVSVRAVDPLYQRRAATPVQAPERAEPVAAPAVTLRTTPPVTRRTTRVTTLRRN
jgi:type VI secretion system protein ImpH